MTTEVPLRPYQPSNGTEGACFMEHWCANCTKDRVLNGTVWEADATDDDLCPIVAKTMAHKPGDHEYPREWCYDERGLPVCTAFEAIREGQPLPDRRETWQKELDRISGTGRHCCVGEHMVVLGPNHFSRIWHGGIYDFKTGKELTGLPAHNRRHRT